MDVVRPQQAAQNDVDNSLRAKKRKLEDAFHSLDNAVQGPAPERPSPAKKTQLARSLYSSLAKYGIKPKETKASNSSSALSRSSTAPELGESASKTPHLTAILSRAASRTKSAFTFKFTPSTPSPLAPGAEYRPSSLQSFLTRLETYKLSTWVNKPPGLDAVSASRCGWTNDGKDRLECGLCQASWVVTGREGMSREAANALVEKQRQGLVENHKSGCPWRTRQCDTNIYCIPLKSPTSTVKDIKTNAVSLHNVMEDVAIKHPLTPNQLSSLKKAVAAYQLPPAEKDTSVAPPAPADDAMDVDQLPHDKTNGVAEPSETAVIASLFGWSIVPPQKATPAASSATSLEARMHKSASSLMAKFATTSTASPSRPASRFSTPTKSRQASPALSRASPGPASRLTPASSRLSPSPAPRLTPATSRTSPMSAEKRASTPLFKFTSAPVTKREGSTLHCTLCQRRVGLWAFTAAPKATAEPSIPSGATDKEDQQPKSPANPSRSVKPLPQRQFDLLKEHRSYCPYVVKSTVVPSLPTITPPTNGNGERRSVGLSRSLSSLNNPNAALEGWRAVLAVLLRYNMAERQRAEYDVFGRVSTDTTADTIMEEDPSGLGNVKAMVAGVKQRGGLDLLKYVKGLLG